MSKSLNAEHAQVVEATRAWVDRAVIGLNLCPFAKAVQAKGSIRYAVSKARSAKELLDDLRKEMSELVESDRWETTLLMVPGFASDFLEFNTLVARADRLLAREGHAGVLQLASFHPQYQFSGAEAGDITNFSNRSPYPTLHLLREASVDRAVAAFPEPQAIYEANMRTLRRLGREGWDALGLEIP